MRERAVQAGEVSLYLLLSECAYSALAVVLKIFFLTLPSQIEKTTIKFKFAL